MISGRIILRLIERIRRCIHDGSGSVLLLLSQSELSGTTLTGLVWPFAALVAEIPILSSLEFFLGDTGRLDLASLSVIRLCSLFESRFAPVLSPRLVSSGMERVILTLSLIDELFSEKE